MEGGRSGRRVQEVDHLCRCRGPLGRHESLCTGGTNEWDHVQMPVSVTAPSVWRVWAWGYPEARNSQWTRLRPI